MPYETITLPDPNRPRPRMSYGPSPYENIVLPSAPPPAPVPIRGIQGSAPWFPPVPAYLPGYQPDPNQPNRPRPRISYGPSPYENIVLPSAPSPAPVPIRGIQGSVPWFPPVPAYLPGYQPGGAMTPGWLNHPALQNNVLLRALFGG